MIRYIIIAGFLYFTPHLFAQSYNESTSVMNDVLIKEMVKGYAENAVAVVRGEHVYISACKACHGATGDGNGPAAKELNTKPRDFTQGTYKFRSTPSGELPADEDLFNIISEGVPRTYMPAWKNLLSERETSDVVAYIKTFTEDFEEYGAGIPIKIPEEPPISESSIAEGSQIYKFMECWACHGKKGLGDGPSATSLKDAWGNRIKAFDFTLGGYKAGNSTRDIYKTFNTGLDGTPMPSYQEAFLYSRGDFENLTRYQKVYSQNKIEELRDYGKTIPDDQEIEAMSMEKRDALVNKRRWSLVHFVNSLSREKSMFYKLFFENTEETK